MVTIYWKLAHTPKGGSETILTELYDPVVRVKTGDGKDSFSFKVNNVEGDFNNAFNPNDKMIISRQQNSDTGWANSDILLTGAVRTVPHEVNTSQDLLRVEGYNYSETVMGALVFVEGAGKTLDVFLEDAVNSVASYNVDFGVTWNPNNPAVKYTDGTSFPIINERVFNKPLSYILEKYSTKETTEDGRYYWFVNKDNELTWDKRSNDSGSRTFDQSTDDFQSIKIKKDIKDVKNFVIIKGGLDPKGNPMQNRYADYTSISKHGFRYYIFVSENASGKTNLSADLTKAEVDDMEDATYPFVPTWDPTVTATDYDDYVTEFRSYFKGEFKTEGKKYIDLRKNGKLKVTITFQAGDKPWGLADLVSCNIPSLSSSQSKLLRVEEIQYSTTTDTFTLIEDEGSI